jgi:diaminopimelate epimerase
MTLPFVKMNGLGNDFVIVTPGAATFEPAPAQVRAIWSDSAHVGMRIWNADGGEVATCGNAARCVGWLVMEALSLDHARIATSTGWLEADRAGERRVTVDMGAPRLGWRDIPLAREMDTVKLDIAAGPELVGPGCVSMGNPHVVFFVPDLEFAPVTPAAPAPVPP